jgi:hypothetical protein
MTNQVKLHNTELDRPFFVSMPEFISRKLLIDIKPTLDGIAQISRNRALEKYFMDNPAIMEYISMSGVVNPKKVKEVAEEMGLDPKDKKAYAEAEGQVRTDMITSFPGIVQSMKSYDIEIDINDEKAWALCIDLIRQTGVCKQTVDKEILEKNEDPNGEFWNSQSIEEVAKYAQFFRRYIG